MEQALQWWSRDAADPVSTDNPSLHTSHCALQRQKQQVNRGNASVDKSIKARDYSFNDVSAVDNDASM